MQNTFFSLVFITSFTLNIIDLLFKIVGFFFILMNKMYVILILFLCLYKFKNEILNNCSNELNA